MVVVVPKEESLLDSKTKKYVGNNMNLDLVGTKKKKILIVGNNSSVQIKENLCSIKIVGDNCTLNVTSGGGEVVYIGNNGSVFLDHSIDEKVVTYIGKNGTVSAKNGVIKRHGSESDVRNCGKMKFVNVDGQCNICISGVRTRISAKKFGKIASTISLPNIQIHVGAPRHN